MAITGTSVKDFGAVGDGVTNDAAAFGTPGAQAVFVSADATNVTVQIFGSVVTHGTYNVNILAST